MNRWTVGSDPSGPGAIAVHQVHVDLEQFTRAMQSVIQAIRPIGASCGRLAEAMSGIQVSPPAYQGFDESRYALEFPGTALRSPLGAEEDPHGWTYPEADAMSWTPPESGVEGVPRWLA